VTIPLDVPVWSAELLIPDAGELCEGPRWDDRTGTLLWTDIYACVVHEVDADGARVASHPTRLPTGSFAPRRGGGYVLAVETGFVLVDPDWKGWEPVGTHRSMPTRLRSNDGACDPRGRFLAGTMGHHDEPGAGAVLRLDARGPNTALSDSTAVIDGTTIANGIDWSVDGTTMYFVDSAHQRVDAFDYDLDTGTPSNRRPLVVITEDDGCPDGLTIDAEGSLWVALWDGGQVRRYDSLGRLSGIVSVPVRRVSSCTFGGPDLRDLFITTARVGLDAATLAAYPDSGGIYRCRPGPVGRPVARFAG
jgi:sugar lactone lactonase YvrE